MDYYAILGVTLDAETIVIDAAYKALVKKYHPDVWRGDKQYADEKIKSINEAYSVLSDPEKRKKYDAEIKDNGSTGNYDEYSEGEDDEGSELRDDWKIVAEYYPEAEEYRLDLATISKKAALAYQLTILAGKFADKHEEVAAIVKNDFLNRYFGPNEELQNFVLNLLKDGNKKDALEINLAIKTLGFESSEKILERAQEKISERLAQEEQKRWEKAEKKKKAEREERARQERREEEERARQEREQKAEWERNVRAEWKKQQAEKKKQEAEEKEEEKRFKREERRKQLAQRKLEAEEELSMQVKFRASKATKNDWSLVQKQPWHENGRNLYLKGEADNSEWSKSAKQFYHFFTVSCKFPKTNCYFLDFGLDENMLVKVSMLDPTETAKFDAIFDYELVEFEIDLEDKIISSTIFEPEPQVAEKRYRTESEAFEFIKNQLKLCA